MAFLLLVIIISLSTLTCGLYMATTLLVGGEAQGRVIRQEQEYDSDTETSGTITFIYRVNGIDYTRSHDNAGPTSPAVNQPVKVKYLPLIPGWAPLLPAYTNWAGLILLWIFAIWTAIVLVIMFVSRGKSSAEILVSHGIPATATVIKKGEEIDRGEDGKDRHIYWVRYEFAPQPNQTGDSYQARQDLWRPIWIEVHIGEQITVLYNPENPRENLLYPFSEYRVRREGESHT